MAWNVDCCNNISLFSEEKTFLDLKNGKSNKAMQYESVVSLFYFNNMQCFVVET